MALHVLTITPFYPASQGDPEGCFVEEPIRLLRESGTNAEVIAIRPFYKKIPPEGGNAEWVRYFALPGNPGLSSAGLFLFARLISKIRRRHAREPIHVIHAHGALPCGHAAALLSRTLGIPFVVTVHGLDAFSTRQVQGWTAESCRRISRYVYSQAARVICVSQHVQESVQAGAPRANCRIVYNGVDTELFSSDGGNREPETILSVGNLIPSKGHGLVIRSFAELAKKYPALTCEIIGEGVERVRLERLSSNLGVANKVRFRGRRSRVQTAEAMRDCRIFALPSSYEALGCVYLEAMAAARPVIGCRGQGIEEIIRHGKNGILLATGEIRELVAAITLLLDNPKLREQMGQAAQETVQSGFKLEYQAEELNRIYEEVSA